MIQAAVIAVGGFLVALVVVRLAVPLTAAFLPQISLQIMPDAVVRVGSITVLVALAASMLPVRKLVRVDPVYAFRN